jgi:transposase
MARVKTWEVSDAFWDLIEPLVPHRKRIPGKNYKRKPGGGRKPAPVRKIFEAIVYVLRNGMIWNALPKEKFGICSSTVHRVFLEWCEAGFFLQLWRSGLAEYDEMEGIAWEWQSADGCLFKAPLAKEAVGPNPTDRGKKRKQTPFASRRKWCPAVDHRNRSKLQ